MASDCFCGCGREVPFGRKRATNTVGRQYQEFLDVFRGALEKGSDPEHAGEMRALVAEGEGYVALMRDVIHGTRDRKEFDKDAMKAWFDRAVEVRKNQAQALIHEDYVGWNSVEHSELLHAGARAPAEILAVEDTGTTLNTMPKVRLRLRVSPEGGEPFELERKVFVSRVDLPRRGEQVEVLYDRDEPTRFTFRRGDLTDDPVASGAGAGPSLSEEIEKLAELHKAGALSAEEFAAAKARLLAG